MCGLSSVARIRPRTRHPREGGGPDVTQIASLFAELPGLAQARTELAFIDLVGFRAFNNAYGQERGDGVLRLFASALDGLEGASAIRDGGDEFLIIGSPTRRDLDSDLEELRHKWPRLFHETFGDDVPPVETRALVAETRGRALRGAREVLGREIGRLKLVGNGSEPVLEHIGTIAE